MSVVPEDSIIFKSNYCDSLLNEADHESFQEDQIMNLYPKSNAASPQHKNQSRDIFHKFWFHNGTLLVVHYHLVLGKTSSGKDTN